MITYKLSYTGAQIDAKLGYVDVSSSLTTLLAAKLATADLLTEILDIDGSSSGIDADLLDGQHGVYYQATNSYLSGIDQDLDTTATPTFTGYTITGGVNHSGAVASMTVVNGQITAIS